MANGELVRQDDGSGEKVATYSFSEDAVTRHSQRCTLNTSAGAEVGTSGAPLRVDPTGTTAQPITDNAGSLTVDNAALSVTGGGVEATALRVTVASDSTGVLSVDDNGASLTVDGTVSITANSAVNMAQVGGTNVVTGGVNGSQGVGGLAAHSATVSGNPLLNGYNTIAYGANPTPVDAGEVSYGYANRAGVQIVTGPHMNPKTIEFTQADADGQQTNVALVSVSAGTKIAVTQVQVLADQSNTVETSVRIGFAASTLGAASTTPVAGIVASHPGIVPGAGISRGDGMGILGVGADDEDLRITISDPVGGNNVVVVSYFTIES